MGRSIAARGRVGCGPFEFEPHFSTRFPTVDAPHSQCYYRRNFHCVGCSMFLLKQARVALLTFGIGVFTRWACRVNPPGYLPLGSSTRLSIARTLAQLTALTQNFVLFLFPQKSRATRRRTPIFCYVTIATTSGENVTKTTIEPLGKWLGSSGTCRQVRI